MTALPELIDCRGLVEELGVRPGVARAILEQLPAIRIAGVRKRFVRRADVLELVQVDREPPAERGSASVGSAHVRTRATGNGEPRYQVRYRIGGRGPLLHGGTFRRLKDARTRRDAIAGELAAGRNPADLLAQVKASPARRTVAQWAAAFRDSRVDVQPATLETYGYAMSKLDELGRRHPEDLTPADVQEWIAGLDKLAPSTIKLYLAVLRQILDFAGVEPNPARSAKVKTPTRERIEPAPPSRDEWDKAKDQVTRPVMLLALRLLEATGLRVGELVSIEWGDVDFATGRFRVSSSRTKGRTAGRRWLPVPPVLLDEIAELVPFEDRDRDQQVFAMTDQMLRHALSTACKDAGIAHYHPHDLRHRRISLWTAHGIDPVTVKTWSGHTNASMSLDVYSHVVVAGAAEWREVWLDTYDAHRAPAATRARMTVVVDSEHDGGTDG